MRKYIYIISIFLLIISCSKKNEIENAITNAADSKFELTINNVGESIYRLKQDKDKGLLSKNKIKNSIDKYLKILPTKIQEGGVSYTKNLCDRYEWETPKLIVHLWVEYSEKSIDFEVTVVEK